jgi:serine phosphatase RsbU (regulator of sigma subunit)
MEEPTDAIDHSGEGLGQSVTGGSGEGRRERGAPEVLVRAVIAAGRAGDGRGGIARGSEHDDVLTRIEGSAYRTVASALLGVEIERAKLDAALDDFAAAPTGPVRFHAMVDRTRVALSEPSVADERAGARGEAARRLSYSSVVTAFARALARHGERVARSYERFAAAAGTVAQANDHRDVCSRAVRAVRELSGLQTAVLYIPGDERARFVAADSDVTGDGPTPPSNVRIDEGLLADVLAGERVVYVTGAEAIESVLAPDIRTLVAVPLRDAVGRPVGIALALDSASKAIDVDDVEALRRLGTVIQGALAATGTVNRDRAALGALPELAAVAAAADQPITDQLEQLARIVAESTASDNAVIRVRDAAGHFLETRAVHGLHGDSASSLVGTKTELDTGAQLSDSEIGVGEHEFLDGNMPDDWSTAGGRIIDTLEARSMLSFPIPSIYQRSGVLYLVRRTSRPFDEVDRACVGIVGAHLQHVIDRHVASLQTTRAIRAAGSAIRTLGEALVAGVRTERTIRFVPRLYREMFDCTGCRVWRQDTSGTRTLIASTGTFDREAASAAVDEAFERALSLSLSTETRPHRVAIGIDELAGSRIAIEFELRRERTLGQEEQRIAQDVAERIAEALQSAEQAALHQYQIDRIRMLQDIVALAHEELSERHVIATMTAELPRHYDATNWIVMTVGDRGELEKRTSHGIPEAFIDAVERARHWAPGAVGDERLSVLAIEKLSEDPRTEQLVANLTGEDASMRERPMLAIPLVGRSQTAGCLLLFPSKLPHDIDIELRTLPIFGRHVGAALASAREFEREHSSRERVQRVLEFERDAGRQVRALYEVSRTFATSLSLDETMRAVVEAMADRLDVDAVWLRTPDDRGDKMLLRAFYAPSETLGTALERIVDLPEQRSDAINTHVWSSRQPLLISAESLDSPEFAEYADAEIVQRLRPFLGHGSTLAIIPIATPSKMLGTVTMLSIDIEHTLTDDKIDTAKGVTSQAALAIDNARLYKEQKRFADVIQESLLPSSLPQVPGIDLSVLYRSATGGGAEVGGDFYDFLQLDDGRLALVVGDVCGKGVGAAANTAMTKYTFRALAREHPLPSSFLRYANDVIFEEIEDGKFVTLFYALIDPSRNVVLCGNAGHPEPKLVRSGEDGKGNVQSLGMEGLALGILSDQDYEQREYPFEEGCSLVVYTDGVVEARRGGRLYGQYRLERLLGEEAGASAPHLTFEIYKDCEAYAEDGLADDVAIVVAQRIPEEDL